MLTFSLRLKMLAVVTGLLMAATAQAGGTYNTGASYANPDSTTTDYNRGRPCNDPWVGIALVRVYGYADPAMCATGLYNGGQWRDFNELVHAVARTRDSMLSQNVKLESRAVRGLNANVVAVLQAGRIVAAGGGNMVAAGAGNMVAAGAGNIIVDNGGNLVAAGGGNFVGNAGGNVLPVAKTFSGRSVMSGRTVRLPTGGLVFE